MFALVFATTLASITSTSDMELLLCGLTGDSGGGFTGLFEKDDETAGNNGNGQDGTVTKTITETVQAGTLNLSLIDRIPDVDSGKKGYIKELLTFARDAEEGKLGKSDVTATVKAILGIWNTEVKADRQSCPNFYFLPSEWKKNSKDYSFAGFTSKSSTVNSKWSIDAAGAISFAQEKSSSLAQKSKVNPKNNTRGASPGDARFVPDEFYKLCLDASASENSQYYTSYNKEMAVGVFTGAQNNRGSIKQQMSGLAYCCERTSPGSIENISKNTDQSKFKKKIKGQLADAVMRPFIEFNSKSKHKNLITDDTSGGGIPCISGQGLTQFLVTIVDSSEADQWFITKETYNSLVNSWKYCDAYKYMTGSKESDAKIKEKLKKHVADDIATSVKRVNGGNFSSEDAKKAYGYSSYQNAPYTALYPNFGAVWYVSKIKDEVKFYKNATNTTYHIVAFDGIGAGYLYGMTVGDIIYAKMLKEAGINEVDPTNPESYMNMITKTITRTITVKQGAKDGKIDTSGKKSVTLDFNAQWLAGSLDPGLMDKVKTKDLTPERIAILNAAWQMANGNYYYSYGSYGWHDRGDSVRQASGTYTALRSGFYTDCAHFCELSYWYAGFKQINSHLGTDSLMKSPYSIFKEVDIKDAMPGDIVVVNGHAVIYLSGTKVTNMRVLHASSFLGNDPKRYDEQVLYSPNHNILASHKPPTKVLQVKDNMWKTKKAFKKPPQKKSEGNLPF